MIPRLLVLSDLHISPPGPLATFHQGPALAAFLHANARADTTLVLAGDIIDAEVSAWIDRLEAGDVERVRLPTYAEVTAEGSALRAWPGTTTKFAS